MNPQRFKELLYQDAPQFPTDAIQKTPMERLEQEILLTKLEEVWPVEWEKAVSFALEGLLSLEGKKHHVQNNNVVWDVRITNQLASRSYSRNRVLRQVRRNLAKGVSAFIDYCTSSRICRKDRCMAALFIYMRYGREEAAWAQ